MAKRLVLEEFNREAPAWASITPPRPAKIRSTSPSRKRAENTVGAGFTLDERLTYKAGAAYLPQAVDDEDRTLAMRVDAIWVPGVGLTYQLAEGRTVDVNANYLNLGKAPVDTGEGLLGRRVVGESTDLYAITLELAYHF